MRPWDLGKLASRAWAVCLAIGQRVAALAPAAHRSRATAAAILEEGDGYAAAMTNLRFMANTVWDTREATKRIETLRRSKP